MHDQRELEAKFEADDDAQRRLMTLERFGDFTRVASESKAQDDLYYDTAEGHLKVVGATLRIRRRNSGAQMTFKGQRQAVGDGGGHVVSRLEDEVDLDPDVVAGLVEGDPLVLRDEPPPLERARLIVGELGLLPTARLWTDRSVLLFENSDNVQVELAIDRSRATRLADGREVHFSEVEMELKRGAGQALIETTQALQSAVPGLIPSMRTKLERALD